MLTLAEIIKIGFKVPNIFLIGHVLNPYGYHLNNQLLVLKSINILWCGHSSSLYS